MKLFNEMKSAMASVIEAEENAAAWKQEAAVRMKKVNNLIRAEEIASEIKVDRKTVIEQLREYLAPVTVTPEAEQPQNVEAYSEPDIPDNVEASSNA